MDRELDYAKDSKIDIDALDLEWMNQPDLEHLYIKQVSIYRRRVIKLTEKEILAHEKVKSVRSKLVQKCHQKPEKYVGATKATEKQAEAFYRTHPDYLIAKRKWIKIQTKLENAKDDWQTASDMKDLIHFTRTKALEELVNLHGQSYFAGPNVPRDLTKEIRKKEKMEEKLRKRSKKIGNGLIRRN